VPNYRALELYYTIVKRYYSTLVFYYTITLLARSYLCLIAIISIFIDIKTIVIRVTYFFLNSKYRYNTIYSYKLPTLNNIKLIFNYI